LTTPITAAAQPTTTTFRSERELTRMKTLVVGSEGLLLEPLVRDLTSKFSEVSVLGSLAHASAAALGGDPTAMDFGLSGEQYRKLVASIDHVVLAEVPDRTNVSGSESAGHVRAAEEVLEFVRAGGGRAQVTFLSSLLVFGSGATRVSEKDFRVGQSFDQTFDESLAISEQTVRLVEKIDVPLAVLRIAPLVGDREKGVLDRSSVLFELIELLRGQNVRADAPFTSRPVHFETYDHAAEALARLAMAKGPRTAHLVRPRPPTDRELCEWLREALGLPPFRDDRIGSLIRRPPLLALRSKERRAFSGSVTEFGTEEARSLGLLDESDWASVLGRVLKSEIERSGEPEARGRSATGEGRVERA
jgi:Male sterility protein